MEKSFVTVVATLAIPLLSEKSSSSVVGMQLLSSSSSSSYLVTFSLAILFYSSMAHSSRKFMQSLYGIVQI